MLLTESVIGSNSTGTMRTSPVDGGCDGIMRFYVFMIVLTKIHSFWDIMPCGWVNSYKHTGRVECVLVQGQAVKLDPETYAFPRCW
jgi:hypothetical protein